MVAGLDVTVLFAVLETRAGEKMVREMSLFLTFAMMAALIGCGTPYQPLQRGVISPGGGYASRQIGENEYEVFFGGNGFTFMETVKEYWHRKARELCGSDNYEPNVELYRRDGFPGAKGTVKCKQPGS